MITLLLLTGYALAQKAGGLDLSKVTIPKELGTVKEVYQSPLAAKKRGKMIFHIQDVHVNYEAQKNMANILEYLIQTYGINIILVEGGITDKDFSYIREWAPLDERKLKAEELLKEGVISGETYVDIASDFPLKFQGIEDKELYEENMEIYLKVDAFRQDAFGVTEEFRNVVEKLKKFIYTRRLKEFDKKREAYKSEKLEMVEYLEFLDEVAAKEDISLDTYPNHKTILETSRLEKSIDFDVVEKERDILIERLTKKLPKDQMDELLIMSVKFKEDKLTPGEFYSYLGDISRREEMKMNRFKNIERYITYITTYETLDSSELFKEIEGIEDSISDLLCKNDEQRELFMISKNLATLESLLRLKLAPEDLRSYRANRSNFNLTDWKIFLRRHSNRFRLKAVLPEDTSAIDNNLKILESFYDTAFKRDDAFLKNSLKKMKKEREDVAFLIAGGFHTKNLTRLFMAKNISYIVITPKLTKKTDDRLYDRILKESYETRTWDD